MGAENEIVAIVDKKNRLTGKAARKEMRRQGLIHRATYILVFNTLGDLFVHKRTVSKDVYTGFYDIAAGGVVLAAESYEESASRELAEELGIHREILENHFDFFYEDGSNKVWGRVFSCIHDGPITLQVEEVESGVFMSLSEVLKCSEKELFTPDSLYILKRFFRKSGG